MEEILREPPVLEGHSSSSIYDESLWPDVRSLSKEITVAELDNKRETATARYKLLKAYQTHGELNDLCIQAANIDDKAKKDAAVEKLDQDFIVYPRKQTVG